MSSHFQTNINDEQITKILFQMTELALSESASLISSLGNCQLRLTVNSIGLNNKEGLDNLFNPKIPDILAVSHQIDGPNSGHIVFIMEELAGLIFTKEVLNDRDHLQELSGLEEETWTELGNIIINNFLSHYLQVLNQSITTLVPTFERGHYAELFDNLNGENEDKEYYIVKLTLEIATHIFSAYILWFDHLCKLESTQTENQKISNS